MAIVGIGTDIVEVERIARFAQKPGALERIFTPEEIAYCRARKNQYQHLAVRFAAKEAVYKALPFAQVPFRKIGIFNLPSGRPEVQVDDPRMKGLRVFITLSHTEAYATATAVIEQ